MRWTTTRLALAYTALAALAIGASRGTAITAAGPLRYSHTLGQVGVAGTLTLPEDVAIAGDGTVYVVDSYGHVAQRFSPEGVLLAVWGGFGRGDGRFVSPHAVAALPQGGACIADGTGRIQCFDPGGGYRSTGKYRAADMSALEGDTLMTLGASGTVRLWSADGALASQWLTGWPDNPDFPFARRLDWPFAGRMTVGATGDVLVSYPDGRQVGRFSAAGEPLGTTASPGPSEEEPRWCWWSQQSRVGPDPLCFGPVDVAVGPDGSEIILEAVAAAEGGAAQRVRLLTPAGEVAASFDDPTHGAGLAAAWKALDVAPDGTVVLVGRGLPAALRLGADLVGVTEWPAGDAGAGDVAAGGRLAVLPTGDLIVADRRPDQAAGRVRRLSADGTARDAPALPGGLPGAGPDGSIYVARDGRIVRRGPDGGEIGAWDASVFDFDVGGDGRLYVLADACGPLRTYLDDGRQIGEFSNPSWGFVPGLEGHCPSSVAYGSDGLLYVVEEIGAVDRDASTLVQAYTPEGVAVRRWDLPWLEPYTCRDPIECYEPGMDAVLAAAPDGTLYVNERVQGRVMHMDVEGRLLGSFVPRPESSAHTGPAYVAHDIALGPQGSVYLTLRDAPGVLVYTARQDRAFRLELYDNPWLAGAPTAVSRADSMDFDWGTDPPAPGLPWDGFSARVAGAVEPGGSRAAISVRASGGVKVWWDERLLVDDWQAAMVTRTIAVDARAIAPQPVQRGTAPDPVLDGPGHWLEVEYRHGPLDVADPSTPARLAVEWKVVPDRLFLPATWRGEPTPPLNRPLGLRRLAATGRRDWQAEMSNSGSTVVYVSEDPATGESELRAVDRAGGGERSLPMVGLRAVERPRFLPGRQARVIFAGQTRDDGHWDLYRYDMATAALDNLTNTPDVDERRPAVQPHGPGGLDWSFGAMAAAVAYDAEVDGDPEVFVRGGFGAAGSLEPPQRLTRSPGMDGVASFSPGGRWLVFRSERDSNSEIYMMDVAIAAHPLQRLTDSPSHDGYPSFAPDGRVLFQSDRGGHAGAFILDPVTGTTEGLVIGAAQTATPLFTPDGLAVLAALDVGAGLDVYLIGFPLDGARLELGVGNPRR